MVPEGGVAGVGTPIAFVAETEADLEAAKAKASGACSAYVQPLSNRSVLGARLWFCLPASLTTQQGAGKQLAKVLTLEREAQAAWSVAGLRARHSQAVSSQAATAANSPRRRQEQPGFCWMLRPATCVLCAVFIVTVCCTC